MAQASRGKGAMTLQGRSRAGNLLRISLARMAVLSRSILLLLQPEKPVPRLPKTEPLA